jgi:hypothetical protein
MDENETIDDINLRILRVADDLRVIQRELNTAAIQATGRPELLQALHAVTETEALDMLKSVLDQMRHFLWFYAQVMTDESELGDQMRQTLRQSASRGTSDQRANPEALKWPSDAALIRLLADGRDRKPN